MSVVALTGFWSRSAGLKRAARMASRHVASNCSEPDGSVTLACSTCPIAQAGSIDVHDAVALLPTGEGALGIVGRSQLQLLVRYECRDRQIRPVGCFGRFRRQTPSRFPNNRQCHPLIDRVSVHAHRRNFLAELRLQTRLIELCVTRRLDDLSRTDEPIVGLPNSEMTAADFPRACGRAVGSGVVRIGHLQS